MMVVDDEGVSVSLGRVMVGMTVRFRAFPSFMRMLVMLVMHMPMQMVQRRVIVNQHITLARSPYRHCNDQTDKSTERHDRKCGVQPYPSAEPPRQRIGQ
jgi:hypothetical protein